MKISQYKVIQINKRKIYIGSPKQKDLDRKVHEDLKRKYRLYNKNRDYIIRSIINTLVDSSENIVAGGKFTIINIDIADFFSSINTPRLYRRILRSGIIKDTSLRKIKQIVFSSKIKGIPQGVSFSSALAEIYLEDFDKKIPLVYSNLILFKRYVDDIIIICWGDHTQKVVDEGKSTDKNLKIMKDILGDLQLGMNKKHSVEVVDAESEFKFSYLGYTFTGQTQSEKLNVSVDSKKIKKYKKSIRMLFSKFNRGVKSQSRFYKLYYNLRNLLWETGTKNFKNGKEFTFGFKYNYREINDYSSFDEINQELKSQIYKAKSFYNQQKRLLHSLFLDKDKVQKFNFNSASKPQLIGIMRKLNVTPQSSIGTERLCDVWISQIFKELYN